MNNKSVYERGPISLMYPGPFTINKTISNEKSYTIRNVPEDYLNPLSTDKNHIASVCKKEGQDLK